jgi:4-amino-4-deoxy-L-arabinose transferase-like glycosyltransferase
MDPEGPSLGTWPILKDYRVWAIAGLALLLSMVMAVRHFSDDPASWHGDNADYHHIAVTLLAEGYFDGAFRAPGYPLLVASVYAICGPRPFAVYVVQAVLVSAALLFICGSVFWITKDKTIALLAMSLSAAYPPVFKDCVPDLANEGLALFLVALFVRLYLATVQTPSLRRCAASGLSLAAVVYTKQVMLPYVGIAAVYLVWHHRAKAGRAAKGAAVLCIVATLAILPWTYRNYLFTGRLVPVSTGFGLAFWQGWWPPEFDQPQDRPDYNRVWPHTPPEVTDAIRGMSEVERDDYLTKIAASYIVEAPGTAAVNALHKFSNLWLGNFGANTKLWKAGTHPRFAIGQFAIPALSLAYVPVFLLALGGYWLLAREAKQRAAPIMLMLTWWTLAYVVTFAGPRYVTPVYCYVLSFAAVAVVKAYRRFAGAK